jgi:serine/threonine protein kinase
MTSRPGDLLLHYRLVERIGAGGMGVVWKAADTKLGREVAVKILPPEVADDPGRLTRFKHEARSLASLNHPNIAQVHGLEQDPSGVRFIALEWVPGEDLAERAARGPVPPPEAIEIGRQVATGLEAAHQRGIVHRDLKPANVRITPDGQVKLLDFGLAKTVEAPSARGNPSVSPTVTSAGTLAGTILGTAAYMSPEQARGRPVDQRTDIWAFGCLLLELLTGKPPFRGDTVPETWAAVLEREPDLDAVPAATPRAVVRVIRRCLRKDSGRRLRDIGDAALDLEEAGVEAPTAAEPSRRVVSAGKGHCSPR